MSDAMMRWHIVTSEEFILGEKIDTDLYFLSDTHEIYRGNESYSKSVELFESEFPTTPALNRLYINKSTLEGYVYDGQWNKVIKSINDTIMSEIERIITDKINTATPTLYQGTDVTIEAAVGDAIPKKSDICIITTTIAEDKYSKTAYWYDGNNWIATDGNVNAENVYFSEDLITTSSIGHITLTNGQAIIPASGKSIKQVFDNIFAKEKNPNITNPYVTISALQNKSYEVGSYITPSYNATFNPGKYEYGPDTNVTVSSWHISDTNGNSSTEPSGVFDTIIVEDNTNYKITAIAEHTEGVIPLTNKRNPYAAGKIKSGSKSVTTNTAIRGYRKGFYGTKNIKTNEITSNLIRNLSNATTSTPIKGNVWNVNIPIGAMRVIFAYPATVEDVESVIDTNGLNAEIKSAFTKYLVNVEGANGYTPIQYKVYILNFASANNVNNTYKITL